MSKDDLNEMLNKIERNQRIEDTNFVSNTDEGSSNKEVANTVAIPDTPSVKNAGFITKMKANGLKNKKELEAAEVIYDTQLEKLKDQATAAKRESKAFWDAKSVEVSESIKTYIQSTLSNLENQRLTSKNDAIQNAYNQTSAKVTEIYSDDSLPDIFKESLIQELMSNMKITVERLKGDAIAKKYDLI